MEKKTNLLAVVGSTASGKSALAVALAKKLNGEVISADSMQIYRELSVGTAKPTEEEQGGIPHHMIDCVPPNLPFSVSDYEKIALSCIYDVLSRGKVPVICGGTGFYVNAILYSLSYGTNGGDAQTLAVRKKYLDLLPTLGEMGIYEKLQAVDPVSAQKLHPNDVKRVIRALEIYETTGKRKSEIVDDLTPRFSYVAVTPAWDRAELYNRINARFEVMLKNGWVEEVAGLKRLGLTDDMQSMQAIGYREIAHDLTNLGALSPTTPEIIAQNTRNYAKRQITFFKRLPGLISLSATKPLTVLADEVVALFQQNQV